MDKRLENVPDPVKTLFESFEVFAAAPGGVKKLRELILQLAVMGKLVPQDSEDEPASILLEKIKAEKERLVAEGKIKKGKELPPVEAGEVPFEVPQGWMFVPLGYFGEFLGGGTPSKSRPEFWDGDIPWVSPKDMKVPWIEKSIDSITGDAVAKSSVKMIPSRSILFVVRGMILAHTFPVAITGKSVTINQDMKALVLPIDDLAEYLAFASKSLSHWILDRVQVSSHGTRRLDSGVLSKFPIPVPPITEQTRILAKVDQLMSLCDELETKLDAQQAERQKLNAAALDTLLAAQDQAEFDAAWQRVVDTFDLLYDDPESVPKLRQAILQLAVMGKLVPQDPEDEPAAVLLEKIKKEKARLVAEGKIKKGKELPPVEAGQVPFEVPSGWMWIRSGDLLTFVTSGSRGWAKYYSEKGPLFLRIGNLDYETIDLDLVNLQHVRPPAGTEGVRTRVQTNDILISITGDTGMVGLVPDDLGEAYINQHISLARPSSHIYPVFLARFFTSNMALGSLHDRQRGIKNSLGLEDIRSVLTPLPPLPEQHRIVAKVDQLMSLCDELETKLQRAQVKSESLVAAVVGQFQDVSENRRAENIETGKGAKGYGSKYLYGKYENLRPLLEKGAALRFTDINHYVALENDTIADDESQKAFSQDIVELRIGPLVFPKEKILSSVKKIYKTRCCHALCLSNDGYRADLYKRFRADICIKIDADLLVGYLRRTLCGITGSKVDAHNVVYFTDNHPAENLTPEWLVFHKDIKYKTENEFRIAIFHPGDEKSTLPSPHEDKRLFSERKPYVTIGFTFENGRGMRAVVEEAILSDGTVVYPPQGEESDVESVGPKPTQQPPFLDMNPDDQAEAVFDALFGLGPVPADEAPRTIAEDLKKRGLASFKRFRKDGVLGQAIQGAVKLAVKYGYLDKPRRGYLRAVQADPKLYSEEDWKRIAEQVLNKEGIESEEAAIRICAEWARENCGMEFRRLRRDGFIWGKISKAYHTGSSTVVGGLESEGIQNILRESIPVFDRVLAKWQVEIPHRPIRASMLFVEHCVSAVDGDSTDNYMGTPWFKDVHSHVEAWYFKKYGASTVSKREDCFPGIVKIFDTPFELAIPLKLFSDVGDDGTYTCTLPNEVLPDEDVESFIVCPPSLANVTMEERTSLRKDIVEIVNCTRSLCVDFLTAEYPDDEIRDLALTIKNHIKKTVTDLLAQRQSSNKIALWEAHLAVEKALKVFLRQRGRKPPNIHDLVELTSRARSHGLRLDDNQIRKMPESKDAINSRYTEGKMVSFTNAFSVYSTMLSIVSSCASALERKPIGKNIVYTLQQPLWK